MLQAEHRSCDLPRREPGETHHSDAAPARRSSNGNDRVVQIHIFYFSVRVLQLPVIVAFNPRQVRFQPFINVVHLVMQMRHFQFSLQVYVILHI